MARRHRARGRRATPRVLLALRPGQWAHFTLLPLAGLDLTLPATTSLLALLRGMAISALVLGYGYLLNALSDRDMDRDREKNPLVGMAGPTHPYWAAVMGLAWAALALAATGPGIGLGATLIALGSGAVYSVGPRLKGRPLVCTLLNVTCFAPLLFVGLGTETVGPARWALAAVFSALLFQNQLLHEAADVTEDRLGGLHTSFMVLGPRGTAGLAALAGVAALAGSLWLAADRGATPWLALHALPYCVAVPMAIARHGTNSSRMQGLRRLHRGAALLSGAVLFATLLLAR